MNRDYFKKPIQNDRNSFGYGNNQLEKEAPKLWQGPMWLYAIAGLAVVAALAISA